VPDSAKSLNTTEILNSSESSKVIDSSASC
jgi:hypothetical protein